MKHRNTIIIFFLTLCTIASCRKSVPKGQLIQASGFVIDSVKNKKLPNATIYLYGAHSTFYGITYGDGPLDSTISDANGNFSISYTAVGNSVDYSLAIGKTVYGGYTSQENYVIDAYHPEFRFNFLQQINNVSLKARELNYARVNLKVLSNPYDTLFFDVSTIYGELRLRYRLTGRTIDTSILTRYLPNSQNNFWYQILATQLLDSGGYIRRKIDTLNTNLIDTIVISKTINSTYDLPLRPY